MKTKNLLSLLCLTAAMTASAQTSRVGITQAHYDALKASGQLRPGVQYDISGTGVFTPYRYKGPAVKSSTRSACNCLLALDSTYTVAMPRNDDGSSDTITLPFNFNFYGNTYNRVFINNNGNISFVSPYATFTANPFPDATYNMIAPFWADVDTRDSLSGLVYYKVTPTSMVVKWDNVGYYAYHSDLLSTFQLVITDGSDPLVPPGNNVSFCYGDMQWTTGDASSGTGGFGGVPATVGVNMGNGINYFQVGTFDQAGGAFDGPYSLADGIDFLDNQEIYFNVADTSNIPPVIVNSNICDTIDVFTGDTLRAGGEPITFTVMVSTPEIDQEVNATITCPVPAALSINLSDNTAVFKKYECTLDPAQLSTGLHTVTVTATDNGSPAETSTSVVVVRVNGATGIQQPGGSKTNITLYPNPASHSVILKSPAGMRQITVTDLLGNVVMQENVQAAQHSLQVSGLGSGAYFIRITAENGSVQTLRFIRK